MSTECAICSDCLEANNLLATTPCGHVLHQLCLMQWLERSQTCPQCRARVTVHNIKPVYLNFSPDNAEDVRNLESQIVTLQRTLETKDTEIAMSRLANERLKMRFAQQDERFLDSSTRLHQLQEEQMQLTRELRLKTEEAKKSMAWLKFSEDKRRDLENTVKTIQEAFKVEIEKQRVQQDKLIKELTGRCSTLEAARRKLESELEKRENVVANVREASAATEKSGLSTKPASKAKRAPRKALATLDSNTDPEAISQKRYFLRPRN